MIYIVEDDRNIQEIELFALKNSGYQAVGFETAKEFYGALSEKLPELILLDIMLPDEDGLSILKRLYVDGKAIELTYKEFELLKLLMKNHGIVISRDVIMERVWDSSFEGESRTIDVHVRTLRQKLGDGGALIKTIRNVGYMAEAK